MQTGGMAAREQARHWIYPELPGVDLLRAKYIDKTFVRHTHETFVIAAVTDGVDVFHHGGSDRYAGPGCLALVNPDTPHTGHAQGPEGWQYGAVYPSSDLVAEIAAETTLIRGTPGFVAPVVEDPYTVRLVHQVLRAADGERPRRRHVAAGRRHPPPAAERGHAAAAYGAGRGRQDGGTRACRAGGRMADPPSLQRLAAELGTSPFALLRAFRDTYDMPPHTWLTDARVRRARHLLDEGTAPAEVAGLVGFTDQPHLNRHFSRIVGVPPGAYRRERTSRGA